jgi:hypothetical protein
MFNVHGQKVASQAVEMAAGQDDFQIETEGYAAGMYLLRVSGGGRQGVARVVVRE